MKIVACCKIVPNEEEIQVLPDRTLSMDSASLKISQYDLNALEAGKRLAAETGGSLAALSVGGTTALGSSKLRKDVLSRGAGELHLLIDDSHTFGDSLETAKALAAALQGIEFDVVLCGAGSSDLYAQEVGVQLGTLLDLPTVNNVTAIVAKGNALEVERTLEEEMEVLEMPLPAVLTVSSEINIPSVPAMRDIMQAGKKPVIELQADLSAAAPSTKTLAQLAPEQQERQMQIVEGDGDEAVAALVQFLKKEVL